MQPILELTHPKYYFIKFFFYFFIPAKSISLLRDGCERAPEPSHIIRWKNEVLWWPILHSGSAFSPSPAPQTKIHFFNAVSDYTHRTSSSVPHLAEYQKTPERYHILLKSSYLIWTSQTSQYLNPVLGGLVHWASYGLSTTF